MSIFDNGMTPEKEPAGGRKSKIWSLYRSESSCLSPLSITTDSLLALIFSAVVIIATYYRLYFGVNFADEAYYIAIPFRFVLGDVPFRDEAVTLFSMFSFISYPFFKIFYAIQGSTEGIVLYARHLFFVFSLIVAFGVYKVIRNFLSFAEALVVVSCVVAFVPSNVSALNYNTLAAGLLTLGLFTGAYGAIKENSLYSAVSGFSLALCAVAYPPMLVIVFVALICMARVRKKSIIPTCFGGIIALLCLVPFFKYAAEDILKENISFYSSVGVQGGNWKKLLTVLKDSFTHVKIGIIISGLICMAAKLVPSSRVVATIILLPLLLVFTNKFPTDYTVAAYGFVLEISLLVPWIYTGLSEDLKKFCQIIWIPSAVAALIIGYSSSNGYLNTGIGFFAGGMVSIFLMMSVFKDKCQLKGLMGRGMCLFFTASIAAILVYYQYSSVYWESRIGLLNTTVVSGPYKHLRTTPKKAHFISQFNDDVRKVADKAGSVVFYYDFPAGYLFSDMKPATNTVWLYDPHLFPGLNTALLDRYYSLPEKWPDIIFKFHYVYWGYGIKQVVHNPDYPIDKLLASGHYKLVNSRHEYAIYRKTRTITESLF